MLNERGDSLEQKTRGLRGNLPGVILRFLLCDYLGIRRGGSAVVL